MCALIHERMCTLEICDCCWSSKDSQENGLWKTLIPRMAILQLFTYYNNGHKKCTNSHTPCVFIACDQSCLLSIHKTLYLPNKQTELRACKKFC